MFRRVYGSPLYLLLKYPAGHWDLPKGNIEEGEEPLQTMHREVREETGLIDLKVVPGFTKKIEYFYRRDGKKVHKEVIYFLAETAVEKVTISYEHKAFGWFSFDEALKKVTYPNAKRLVTEAEPLASRPLSKQAS